MSIQRLVLLCPVEELGVKADNENLWKENESADLESLATDADGAEENLGDINYPWDEEDLELAVAEETTDQDNAEEDPTNLTYDEIDKILSNALNTTEQYDAEVALNFTKGILEPDDNNEASEEEVTTKKGSKEEVGIKALEESVAEDVFADDYAMDFADDSAEGLEAKLEEQPKAELSSPPLPDPRRSAEHATQGRGISQVTLCSKDSSPSIDSNSDSPQCNGEYLA